MSRAAILSFRVRGLPRRLSRVVARVNISFLWPDLKKQSAMQLSFGSEFVPDHIEPNHFVNRLRDRVSLWRLGGYQGVTQYQPLFVELLDESRAGTEVVFLSD